MAKQTKDRYVNTAFGSVTESAANTLTFNEIQTSISIFEKVAWIISRIEWYLPTATLALLAAADDLFDMALTASNNISSLALNAAAVIDLNTFQNGNVAPSWPMVRDFSQLPGGGKIIAPRPLYVALKGTSVASAGSVQCRISFLQMVLTPDEYIELIDFYRIVE